MTIYIPISVDATTHDTSGLDGYPAIDFFGSLGEAVYMLAHGTLRDAHLIEWREGFGGWTFYFDDAEGGTYFVTHLDELAPAQEGRYEAGAKVGRLTTSAAKAALINGAHVHVGKTTWPEPGTTTPGTTPGTVPGVTGPSKPARTGGSPRTIIAPSGPAGPSGAPRHLTGAWHELAQALGSTVPTRSKLANHISSGYVRAVR